MFEINNGDITLIQGDSGKLFISGLPTDKNYTCHFAIQDDKRNPVGGEIVVETNYNPSIIFVILPSITDQLTVPKREDTATYNYAIKLCYKPDNYEDTLLLGNKQLGELNTITVYPKKVEGE